VKAGFGNSTISSCYFPQLVLWFIPFSHECACLLCSYPFNFSPVSIACKFQDWGCVLRSVTEIDFLFETKTSADWFDFVTFVETNSWIKVVYFQIAGELTLTARSAACRSQPLLSYTTFLWIVSAFHLPIFFKSCNFRDKWVKANVNIANKWGMCQATQQLKNHNTVASLEFQI